MNKIAIMLIVLGNGTQLELEMPSLEICKSITNVFALEESGRKMRVPAPAGDDREWEVYKLFDPVQIVKQECR